VRQTIETSMHTRSMINFCFHVHNLHLKYTYPFINVDQDFEPVHDDSADDEETIEKDEEEHGDVRCFEL